MIAQGIGFIKDFTKVRKTRKYYRLSKTLCGVKDQARVRRPGEKYGLNGDWP